MRVLERFLPRRPIFDRETLDSLNFCFCILEMNEPLFARSELSPAATRADVAGRTYRGPWPADASERRRR